MTLTRDSLYIAGGADRLITPHLDGSPFTNEVDYDDLAVLRHWREWETHSPNETRYFMYELAQRDVGHTNPVRYYKAVRMIRVTRVPRYLRQAGGDPGALFDQQRDVLAALRQENILFLTLVAKAPDLPLVFSYGVQATGTTPEEAKSMADRSYAVLAGQLDGTYQQLEYQPLTLHEAERLVKYQHSWNHLAMGRGRPMPTGGNASMGGILDGNRTDVEQTANQLESFIRGMGDSSFILSTITVPVPVIEITRAWRNLSQTLSDVRSDIDGARAVTAGIAIPVGYGLGASHSAGQSHSAADSLGHGVTDTHAASYTSGVSEGVSQSQTVGASTGETVAQTHGITDSIAVASGHSDSVSVSQTASVGHSLSESTGASQGISQAQSISHGQSTSEQYGMSASAAQSVTHAQSVTDSSSASVAQAHSVGVGDSSTAAQSAGANWSDSASIGHSGSITSTDGVSHSLSSSLSQTLGVSDGSGDSMGDSQSHTTGSDLGARAGGIGAGTSSGDSTGANRAANDTDTLSMGLTGGGSLSDSLSASRAASLSDSLGISETAGGSLSQSLSAGHSITDTQGVTAGQSVGQSVGQSAGTSASVGQAQSHSVGTGESLAAAQSLGQTQSISHSAGIAQSQATSQGVGQTQAVSTTQSTGQSVSQAQSQAVSRTESLANTAGMTRSVSEASGASQAQAESVQRGISDAYIASMSRSAQTSGSLGLVPSVGVSISRQTRDESKRILAEMLEAQVRRYMEGIESGAFMYQMSLVCVDRETLARGSGLLKSAFWGPGNKARLPQPFHVIDQFDTEEAARLLTHARAFSSYRKREPRTEYIEPFVYSSYITPGEGAAFSKPPTAEAPGILAMQDSMPVFAIPFDRSDRDINLGYIVNGERARISPNHFGIDVSELTHTLVAGVTGSGKTTTLLKLLSEAVKSKKTVKGRVDPTDPTSPLVNRDIYSGALCLDWQHNMRDLASMVDERRFKFFSLASPELGKFQWNLLAVPHANISPVEWANTVADLFMVSYGLGEFARSIVWEHINDLYEANRLEPLILREPVTDATGAVVRPGIVLPAVDKSELPADAIETGPDGVEYANVYTYPNLSRLIGIQELAIIVMSKIEELSSQDAGRMFGTEIRNRYQTVWRRLQYFAPGGPLSSIFTRDQSFDDTTCLTVPDIVDASKGLVTVIEADGLDMGNRKLVLGGVFVTVWRFGQATGEGAFSNGGDGPGTFVALEEAHELFGSQGEGEDAGTTATRTALWESIYRRSRHVGLRLIACVQNPSDIPPAIYSNSSTALIHRLYDAKDRQVVANLMNWESRLDHRRELRYLGELPVGWCIARLDPIDDYLQATPVHFVTDPANLQAVTDDDLQSMSVRRDLMLRGVPA